MTGWLVALLGAVVLGAGAWLRRALQQAEREREKDREIERIIVRAEQERDAIDARTEAHVAAVPGKTDDELETELNR